MRKAIYFSIFITALLIITSCGGVVGSIAKYPFTEIKADNLKGALNQVYNNFPNMVKSDTSLYGKNNGEDFYFVINNEKEMIVFQCNVIAYDPSNDKEVDLSLTAAATGGEVMKLAPKLSFFEKRKYKNIFEKEILPKIYKELKNMKKTQ